MHEFNQIFEKEVRKINFDQSANIKSRLVMEAVKSLFLLFLRSLIYIMGIHHDLKAINQYIICETCAHKEVSVKSCHHHPYSQNCIKNTKESPLEKCLDWGDKKH